MRTDEVPFQITQRADFFEEEVGLETTLKRPIVNTATSPTDAQKYRRLHVIVGDADCPRSPPSSRSARPRSFSP